MGLNAYFTSVVLTQGLSYQVVLGTVFLAEVLFIFLLSLTSFRELLIQSIPNSLKFGITSGIGLFIAFLGLRMSGIVVDNDANLVRLGDLHNPMTLLALFGLFITLILMAKGVKGALFLGMLGTDIVGFFTGQLF